jgi:hypothetical protein
MDFLFNFMIQQRNGHDTLLSGLKIHLFHNITLQGIQEAKILRFDTGSLDAESLTFQRIVVFTGSNSPRLLGSMNL